MGDSEARRGESGGGRRQKGRGGPKKWWHALAASEQDPISLEPLRRCKIEPFTLEESSHRYRFDARVLAAYLVSSQQFVNPLTRRPLELRDCVRPHAHLAKNGARGHSVARAWEVSKDASQTGERERLQAEAREVMRALFGGGGETVRSQLSRPTPAVSRADEAALAAETPGASERTAAEEERSVRDEAYPALEVTTRLVEPASAWAARRRAIAPSAPAPAPPAVRREEAAPRAAMNNEAQTERFRRLADAFGVPRDRDTVRWPANLARWATSGDIAAGRAASASSASSPWSPPTERPSTSRHRATPPFATAFAISSTFTASPPTSSTRTSKANSATSACASRAPGSLTGRECPSLSSATSTPRRCRCDANRGVLSPRSDANANPPGPRSRIPTPNLPRPTRQSGISSTTQTTTKTMMKVVPRPANRRPPRFDRWPKTTTIARFASPP